MLTKGALEIQDDPGNERMAETNDFDANFREK
jgi:hypothetical protein